MGIQHQDAPALRAADDFDAEAASEDKMQHNLHDFCQKMPQEPGSKLIFDIK